MEKWKAVVGYESRYEVSNRGRLRTIGRWAKHPLSKNGLRWWPSRELKATLINAGYMQIGLYKEGSKIQNQHLVHHLVLGAFRGPRPSKNHVGMHLDDTPTNNRLKNLRWGTYKENTQDMFAKGRNNKVFATGENTSSAKLTNKQVRGIDKRLKAGKLVKDIAAEYSVSSTTISHIKSGRYWSEVTGR